MCDKTGTLTRNVMKFKRCSIAGVNYGDDETDEFDGSALLKDLKNSHVRLKTPVSFLFLSVTFRNV